MVSVRMLGMANYVQKTKRLALVGLLLVLVGILVVAFVSWSCRGGYSGPASITIGLPSSVVTVMPVYVAQEENFFTRNGLNTTLRFYDAGLGVIEGMLNGEVDVAAGVSEFPIVEKALRKEGIRVVASHDKGLGFYVIGRKEPGIAGISDLIGKRVGLQRGTIAEFYLGRFLQLQGVRLQDVTLVELKPVQLIDAMANGTVDAVITHQPYANDIKSRLGNKGIIWPAQSSKPTYNLLVGRNDWINQHPDLVKRLLKSLAQAEDFIISHPAEVKTIVQRRFNFEEAYVAMIWPEHQFSLTLDQSLILAMEDEARWMISNNLTNEKQVPNFLNYIYEDSLEAVKPEAVNIIR